MSNFYKATTIGFTAPMGKASGSHLYDGPVRQAPKASASNCTPQALPEMAQFAVWVVEGKSMLMMREPNPGYSFWQAVRELCVGQTR